MAERRPFSERLTDGLERLNKITLGLGVVAAGAVVGVEYLSNEGVINVAPEVIRGAGLAVGAAIGLDLIGNEGWRKFKSVRDSSG